MVPCGVTIAIQGDRLVITVKKSDPVLVVVESEKEVPGQRPLHVRVADGVITTAFGGFPPPAVEIVVSPVKPDAVEPPPTPVEEPKAAAPPAQPEAAPAEPTGQSGTQVGHEL